MPKTYSKKMIRMMNGGLFSRVCGDLFHSTAMRKSLVDKLQDAASKAKEAAHKALPGKRRRYMGGNPGPKSKQARKVYDRMRNETPPRARGKWPDEVEIRGENGKWVPLEKCQMGHYPIDAMSYWNNYGRFLGPRHPEIRKWMRDPENYVLQPRAENLADGARIRNAGGRYQPPVTLPNGVDITQYRERILGRLGRLLR